MKNKFLKEYFDFSIRERNGLLILFIILLVIIISKTIITDRQYKSKYNFEEFEKQIDDFIISNSHPDQLYELFFFDPNTASRSDFEKLGFTSKAIRNILNYRNKGGKFYNIEDLQKIYSLTPEEYENVKDYILIGNENYKRKNQQTESQISKNNLFIFDPNITAKEGLLDLGLNARQADNIIKYREKGGVFRTPEDILKIYGIDNEIFSIIQPYISITIDTQTNEITVSNKNNFSINLNTTDEAGLQQLKGIGPVYSQRIINYRDKLGGFVHKDQLLEVYGFNEELLNNIMEFLIIDTNEIRKININEAEYKELISHPYIDKDNSNKILNYRKFAKEIKSFDELLYQKAITQEFYDKLYLYISTE